VSDPAGERSDEELLATFGTLVDLYNEKGAEGWREGTTDDVVIASAPEWPGGGVYEGAEAADRFMRDFEEAWASVRFEYSDAEVVNGRVLAASKWLVVGEASGAPTSVEFFTVTTLRGELICRFDAFFTREEAVAFARGLPSGASS
jgi:hypothetical protein